MTVLSKFCRLTDPELTCWSKLPQEMLQMVLKQPEITTRENFDACMREFKYGRRRRQYETSAELYDRRASPQPCQKLSTSWALTTAMRGWCLQREGSCGAACKSARTVARSR